MNFRESPGTDVEWFDTRLENKFSNFLFVDERFRSAPVLRRIFSLARKLHFRSLSIEKITEANCSLLHEENIALALRSPEYSGSETLRVCFFRSLRDGAPDPGDFLGYVIVKSDNYRTMREPYTHVYESVLTAHRTPEGNNFLHSSREYVVNTPAGALTVRGNIYSQQNDKTYVCAHVAMRSALSCVLPEADISYARLNALMSVDHVQERIGDGIGLTPEMMEAAFAGLNVGVRKLIHDPPNDLLLTPYQGDLYSFIESGGPAILGFELTDTMGMPGAPTPRHTITVLGHTFNDDAWVPSAKREYFGDGGIRYYSSESWLSAYVVHDDNFGPYYCLPRHYLSDENFRLLYGFEKIPSGISGVDAEVLGAALLRAYASNFPKADNQWYDRLAIFILTRQVVLRSIHVTRDQYLKHLRGVRDIDGDGIQAAAIDALSGFLPADFWMVEASAPELFSSTRRKLGEVLLVSPQIRPAAGSQRDLLAFRFPGVLVMNDGALSSIALDLKGHTGLFSLQE